jgi:hypothetical protein
MRRQPRALGFGLCTVCPLSGYSTSDNGAAALPFPHLGLSVHRLAGGARRDMETSALFHSSFSAIKTVD